MENTSSVGSKLAVTLFLLVFALGFSWFGFGTGLPALSTMLGQWHGARAYVAVPATVVSTELVVSSGDPATQKVHASFAYRYQGRHYTSDRVSTSALSDNFDDFHRSVHARLDQARARGEPVSLWVDPAHPQQALYDRSLRWKPLLFMLPFGLLFPAIGLGAWFLIGFIWFGQHNGASGPGVLQLQSSPGRFAHITMTCFALFWNMISWPIALLLVFDERSGAMLGMLVLLFPAAGLLMLWMAARMWRTRWQVGQPRLEVLQAASACGRFPLRGRIHFAPGFGLRLGGQQARLPLRLSVKLVQTIGSGEDSTETTLWEHCVLDSALARGTASVEFSAPTPAQQAALAAPSAKLDWKLEMSALGAQIGFDLPYCAP